MENERLYAWIVKVAEYASMGKKDVIAWIVKVAGFVSMTGSRRRAIHATFQNIRKIGVSYVNIQKRADETSIIHSALTVIA